jgi:tetratricopeptide (TPR) repeat protein
MTHSARPLALFISYSHKDDDLRAKLDAHLSLLKRQDVFDVWHDRRIAAGREWAGEIDNALEDADVVLLLVSSDFLASDYCYDKEMVRALQRHDQGSARVVPVILRPCDWQSSQFGRLQALPRDGHPVVSYANVDTALTEVALALRALADEIRGGGATSRASNASAAALAPAIQPQLAVPTHLGERPKPTDRSNAPPSAAASKGSTHRPDTPQKRKLKIGAIKFWFVEIGPFELDWLLVSIVLVAGAAASAGITYWFILKPRLDEARDFMRRAEYANAAKTFESVPQWAKALPCVDAIAAQARFGSRLSSGEHIRTLTPELDALRTRYPDAPDVLVFEGLKSYRVDNNPKQALEQFTRAADSDKAHVEAHFLAAGRDIDLAYVALSQGDELQARLAAAEARRLIDRAVSQSPFAETLPRYANQIGELYELEGDFRRAYAGYAKLAPHSLSALQAAFVSWRLPEDRIALRNSLEATEVATGRAETGDLGDTEGWSFRISAIDIVDVHPKAEKLCLLAWAVEISKSLQSPSENENTTATPSGPTASPEPCGKGAVADRAREIVCVQVLTAQQAISPSDARQKVLENWRASRLRCGQELQPLPVLPQHAADAKRAALPRIWGDESELKPI